MSKDTNITWCHHTASPWYGCTECSPGCTHCYAKALSMGRMRRITGGAWGRGAPRVRSKMFEKNVFAWNRAAKRDGVRRRLFPSLMDPFDAEVPIDFFCWFLECIWWVRELDVLLLTKRPQLWRRRIEAALEYFRTTSSDAVMRAWLADWLAGRPPHNVWMGVSVEDQQRADERIQELLKIPANVRFLSCEPLLGPIDLTMGFESFHSHDPMLNRNPSPVSWAIVGGESGPNFRSPAVGWITDIVQQCDEAGVPVFVKQDSGPLPGRQHRIPDHIWVRKEFPKSIQREEAQAMHS